MARVRKRGIGMRWWLGLAFIVVAAVTAMAVVRVLDVRTERAFRSSSAEFALGDSVATAEAVEHDSTPRALRSDLASIAVKEHVALFAFDSDGHLISDAASFGRALSSVPRHQRALRTALSGRRYIQGEGGDGSTLVVGMPVQGGAAAALVSYALSPELAVHLGIVHSQFLEAALLAIAVGAIAGLFIATMIAVRLGRIARAAKAIGEGDFTAQTHDRFPDEVGVSVRRSTE